MENVRAYGAGLANTNFDKNAFLKKPTVLFRVAALVSSKNVLFADIVLPRRNSEWMKEQMKTIKAMLLPLFRSLDSFCGTPCQKVAGTSRATSSIRYHISTWRIEKTKFSWQVCLYGRSSSTCSFATAVGFFAVCGAIGLIVLDAKMDTISSIPTRRRAVLADLVVSGISQSLFWSLDYCFSAIFTGIFLIGFFTFWSKLSSFEVEEDDENPIKTNHAKFGILSALLSFLAWVRHVKRVLSFYWISTQNLWILILGRVILCVEWDATRQIPKPSKIENCDGNSI